MPQTPLTNPKNRGDILYSRKFNGVGVLPPDYSGVALRDPQKEQSQRRPPPEGETCRPKYPLWENDSSDIPTYPKEDSIPEKECKDKESSRYDEDISPPPCQSSPLGRNFNLEDIVLAGLLLLIMNDEETDNGLLIILGLLLLAGI